jgi:putative nucleotidyltransferase with HDIG domain
VRILYRVRQFWRSVTLKTEHDVLEQARRQLSSEQWELFHQLQPADKNHALVVFHKLLEQGESQPDLLTAALLHDIGKLCYRLNPFERALVVIVSAWMPQYAQRLGAIPIQGWKSLPGWHKAFIVAENHANWGAEMANTAGASGMVEALIRRHHGEYKREVGDLEDKLLHSLKIVDNDS